jgi:hypothetical protein
MVGIESWEGANEEIDQLLLEAEDLIVQATSKLPTNPYNCNSYDMLLGIADEDKKSKFLCYLRTFPFSNFLVKIAKPIRKQNFCISFLND